MIILNPLIRRLFPWRGRAHCLSKRDRRNHFRRVDSDLEEVIEADGRLGMTRFGIDKRERLKYPRDDFSCSL
jgi:hypothetical protein